MEILQSWPVPIEQPLTLWLRHDSQSIETWAVRTISFSPLLCYLSLSHLRASSLSLCVAQGISFACVYCERPRSTYTLATAMQFGSRRMKSLPIIQRRSEGAFLRGIKPLSPCFSFRRKRGIGAGSGVTDSGTSLWHFPNVSEVSLILTTFQLTTVCHYTPNSWLPERGAFSLSWLEDGGEMRSVV